MVRTCALGILSDIHYASAAEQARGNDYEMAGVPNPLLRLALRLFRRFVWLRDPLSHNHLLERFLQQAGEFDYLITNGDYSCDSRFIGVSDPAACASVRECLGRLRQKFGDRLLATCGDHEFGKVSLMGNRGGMRLASWHQARLELGLKPFWQVNVGNYVLLGVASSLVALPIFEPDTLPAERPDWDKLRQEHLALICSAFAALQSDQRVLLFCHDPSALPFLWQEPVVRTRLVQIEQTVVGHLHSNLVLWKSRWLSGMPQITFLGPTVKRLSGALRDARHWRPFQVRLCPSLAGVELLKDGGYLTAELELDAHRPARFAFHRLAR
jgi:hypothetical protein